MKCRVCGKKWENYLDAIKCWFKHGEINGKRNNFGSHTSGVDR